MKLFVTHQSAALIVFPQKFVAFPSVYLMLSLFLSLCLCDVCVYVRVWEKERDQDPYIKSLARFLLNLLGISDKLRAIFFKVKIFQIIKNVSEFLLAEKEQGLHIYCKEKNRERTGIAILNREIKEGLTITLSKQGIQVKPEWTSKWMNEWRRLVTARAGCSGRRHMNAEALR